MTSIVSVRASQGCRQGVSSVLSRKAELALYGVLIALAILVRALHAPTWLVVPAVLAVLAVGWVARRGRSRT